MENLSDHAKAAQQDLRDAAAHYQAVVELVLENPNGEFIERLRHAEQRVQGAATVWALAYIDGLEPNSEHH
jgi:hypothetical protein